MSLIASTPDSMQELRKKSIAQERLIDRNGELNHWKISDATQTTLIEKALGIAVLPLAFFWTFLMASLSLGLAFCLLIFRILGRFFR